MIVCDISTCSLQHCTDGFCCSSEQRKAEAFFVVCSFDQSRECRRGSPIWGQLFMCSTMLLFQPFIELLS